MTHIAAPITAWIHPPGVADGEEQAKVDLKISGIVFATVEVPVNSRSGSNWRVHATASALAMALTGDALPAPVAAAPVATGQRVIQGVDMPRGPSLKPPGEDLTATAGGVPDFALLPAAAIRTMIGAMANEQTETLRRFEESRTEQGIEEPLSKEVLVAIARNEEVTMEMLVPASDDAPLQEGELPEGAPAEVVGDADPDNLQPVEDLPVDESDATKKDPTLPTRRTMMKDMNRGEVETLIGDLGLDVNPKDHKKKEDLVDAILDAANPPDD